jgi:hypothetical protein
MLSRIGGQRLGSGMLSSLRLWTNAEEFWDVTGCADSAGMGQIGRRAIVVEEVERFDCSAVRSDWRKRGTANFEDGTCM